MGNVNQALKVNEARVENSMSGLQSSFKGKFLPSELVWERVLGHLNQCCPTSVTLGLVVVTRVRGSDFPQFYSSFSFTCTRFSRHGSRHGTRSKGAEIDTERDPKISDLT